MSLPGLVLAIAVVVAGYLIGGIPWGVIIARLSGGPDPRTLGSGRTGGANTLRAVGPRWALVSGLLDMLKGTVAVLLARVLGLGPEVEVLAGLAAILGHSRSPYIRLQGGRGVSAGFGGLLVIAPAVALIILPVFVIVVLVTRYSSLASLTGSLVGCLALVALAIWQSLPPVYIVYAVAATAMIWLFHSDNIQRLLRGQERKLGSPRQ